MTRRRRPCARLHVCEQGALAATWCGVLALHRHEVGAAAGAARPRRAGALEGQLHAGEIVDVGLQVEPGVRGWG
jgi:hypothetical protein